MLDDFLDELEALVAFASTGIDAHLIIAALDDMICKLIDREPSIAKAIYLASHGISAADKLIELRRLDNGNNEEREARSDKENISAEDA